MGNLIQQTYEVIGLPPTSAHELVAAVRLDRRPPRSRQQAMLVGGAVGGIAGALVGAAVTQGSGGTSPDAALAINRAHEALGVRNEMVVACNHHHLLLLSTNALTRSRPRKLHGRIPLDEVDIDSVDDSVITLRLHKVPTMLRGSRKDVAAFAAALIAVVNATRPRSSGM